MAFQRQGHFIRGHAATVVGYFDQTQTALDQADGDARRAGIDGVFDQLFERGSGTLNHFTRSDAVYEIFGQAADHGHWFPALAMNRTDFETETYEQSPPFRQIFGL